MFEIRTDLDNVTDLEPLVIGEQALPTRLYIRDVTVERGDHHVLTATFTEREVLAHFQEADGWTVDITINRDDQSIMIQSHDADNSIEPAPKIPLTWKPSLLNAGILDLRRGPS